jgi:hypothetical protein
MSKLNNKIMQYNEINELHVIYETLTNEDRDNRVLE